MENNQEQPSYDIKWETQNQHILNICSESLLTGNMADCLLYTNDGLTFPAHRLVLSGGSIYFQNLFANPLIQHNTNPVICLQETNSINLQSALYYIYKGEVNIKQSEFNNFLATAYKLQLKGLLNYNNIAIQQPLMTTDAQSQPKVDLIKQNNQTQVPNETDFIEPKLTEEPLLVSPETSNELAADPYDKAIQDDHETLPLSLELKKTLNKKRDPDVTNLHQRPPAKRFIKTPSYLSLFQVKVPMKKSQASSTSSTLVCKFCSSSFSTPKKLNNHYTICKQNPDHNACPVCDKEIGQTYIKRHLNTMHGIKK